MIYKKVNQEVINNFNWKIISNTFEVVMKILPNKSNTHLHECNAIKSNTSAPQIIFLSRNEKNVTNIFLQRQFKLNIETKNHKTKNNCKPMPL